jgi:hypothetical protein
MLYLYTGLILIAFASNGFALQGIKIKRRKYASVGDITKDDSDDNWGLSRCLMLYMCTINQDV